MLGCSIHEVIRRGEQAYKDLGSNANELSEQQMIAAVSAAPILLERPIVVHNNNAAIGRPPENVLSLFSK